mgnify:CR=1 FL=1
MSITTVDCSLKKWLLEYELYSVEETDPVNPSISPFHFVRLKKGKETTKMVSPQTCTTWQIDP